MELTDEQKREVLESEILGFKKVIFQQECLGKMWGAIGNAEHAANCAKLGSQCMQAVAELQHQLEELK